jgi:RNA polymerase sigma factor (sigma-70 family)
MKMAPQRAASADARKLYCLLVDEEREAYRCAETAEALGATAAGERLQAYWNHFKTHLEVYVQWAKNRYLFDPTVHFDDLQERGIDLVERVLIAFQTVVQERRYDSKKGPPCRYIKRSITNRFQDILRRGRHPTKEECARCWREGGECRFSGIAPPGAEERRRCLRPPAIDRLDVAEASFALAGLQDEWPPIAGQMEAVAPHRPVEIQALEQILIETIWDLSEEELTQDKVHVLREAVLHGKSGHEIAEDLKTSRSNIYQLKRRGIQRLSQLLEVDKAS